MESCTREFLTDPDGLCDRYGREPFYARVFGVPTVFISDSKRALLALRRHADELSGRVGNRDVAEALFGNSVLYQDGVEHARLRTELRPLFLPPSDTELARIVDVTRSLITEAFQLRGIRALEFFRSVMIGVTCAHYLNIDVDLATARGLSPAIDDLGKGLYASHRSAAHSSRYQKAYRARTRLVAFVRDRLDGSAPRGIAAVGLAGEDVVDQAVTLLFAGVDTVSATLTWAFWDLSRLRSDRREPLVDADLGEAFVRPLIRYPPVYFIPRGAVAEVDLDGVRVPQGWIVNVMISALHREFQASGNKRSYMPFGKGPKQCPGQGFALVVGPLILRTLLVTADISSSGGDLREIGYLPGQHPSASPRLCIRPRAV